MIEIDGSYLEAGGQIVRTAVGLSALTGKACKIFNIRAGRPKPGLMAQHLTGVQAVAEICDAELSGATLESTELTFKPGKIKHGEFQFDIGTAGAIALVLQSLTIPAVAARDKLVFEIKGGTDVAWAPSIVYFQNVYCYWLERFGIKTQINILKYGFYPAGGGHVRIEITPAPVVPFNMTNRGSSENVKIVSISSEQLRAANVAERQLETAANSITTLPSLVGVEIEKDLQYVPTLSPGSSLQICAQFSNCRLGAGAIGERNKRAEQVGQEAATLLKSQLESRACVDRWAADQLLPFMALAANGHPEISVAEITNHCLTNIWVIEKFLPVKFEIVGKTGEPGTIKCRSLQ